VGVCGVLLLGFAVWLLIGGIGGSAVPPPAAGR
jgi:hypothetical protein